MASLLVRFGFLCWALGSVCLAFGTFNDISEPQKSILEPINGTQMFRMHGRKGKDEKSWFGDREMRHIYCVREAQCELLKQRTCFGSVLPYNYTSLDLTDSYSQEQTWERLYAYQAIKHVPKCWAVIQPFLCAVFLPKCDEIDGKPFVYLPSLEMCRKTQEPCRILYNTPYFPEFLKCNDTYFPSKCNNDVREMKFNSTGQCLRPLVTAEFATSYYKDIEGCGLQCKDPRYTDSEHEQIHKLIAWGASICFALHVFTVATLWIDWDISSKYPTLVIFYINVCLSIVFAGWLMQFMSDSRDDVVCKRDGTLRQGEPNGGENLSCTLIFILVYYFLIAAMVWFVIFTYTCYMRFKGIVLGKFPDKIQRWSSHFHLIAWSLPLVLTITILATSEVDGDSITGVCFVGHLNHNMRGIFLLGPMLTTLFSGGFFLARGLLYLIRIERPSRALQQQRNGNKIIEKTIFRMTISSCLIFVCMCITFICHLTEFLQSQSWAESLREYIICLISSTYTDVQLSCKMTNRPSVSMTQLHLLSLFLAGAVMSSWVWTSATLKSWGRCIHRIFLGKRDSDKPVRMQKHQIIAQTYAKREAFENQEKISINFKNQYTDPAELNFDGNFELGSSDFTTTWANNLAHFVKRRNACVPQSSRKSSVDSQISQISVRHVSVTSRRNSVESQKSITVSEITHHVARSCRSSSKKPKRMSSRRRHNEYEPRYSRKESTTSMESQTISITKNGIFKRQRQMKRRTGMAPMDAQQISQLLQKGSLDAFLASHGRTTSEDDLSEAEQPAAIMYHHADEVLRRSLEGRGSKNSKNSRGKKRASVKRSRKNSHSRAANKSRQQKQQHEVEIFEVQNDDDDDYESYSSEDFVDPIDLQSSAFSGVSLGAKTNSRNSKRSCDVGIQTNAHEIGTQISQTISTSFEKRKYEEEPDERQSLLQHKKTEKILKRSEPRPEELKTLLYPSSVK